jgi:hypothetical protein
MKIRRNNSPITRPTQKQLSPLSLALKRLATLKTFKQVVATQETRQPPKISAN